MSTAKYPNRNALRDANDIYLDYMRPFVIHHLKQVPGENVENLIAEALDDRQADDFWRKLDEDNDIESAIDFSYFPLIIKENWLIKQNRRNYGFAQRFDGDMTVQSRLWLIREGRNACEHRPAKDLDREFVQTHLFLIAEVLSKINRPDQQHEVETIRNKLDNTKEHLAEAKERLKSVEAENAEYRESLEKSKKDLETAESKKIEYKQENERLSEEEDKKEKRLKKLSRQLKNARAENEKNKKNLSGAKQRLEESEAAQADYKERLTTQSKELKDTKNELTSMRVEKNAFEKYLTDTQNLLTTVAIDDQTVFPSLDTDADVRILDRRGTDKRNYLLRLLEQKQPTLIYVQSEEMVETLLDHIVPEKADFIEKHSEQTSEAEETKILEKLGRGELVAIVSDTTFSTSIPSHCVEHFVFCHLAPSSDAFFNRCQPAFTSANNAYLHFIYESKQNVEDLGEKYPNEETLRKLYQKFRDRTPINTEFINPDNLYNELCTENELDITNLGIETGFSIFEELGFLERNEEGIRRLSTPPRKLEESKIYCRGKKLKEEIANSPAFQHEHSIEQIWEKMLEELNIDSEQTLRESGIHSKHFKILENDSDTQPTTETEQDKITPPTPDVWPQRSLSPFDALRQRAAKSLNDTSLTQFREDGGGKNSPYSSYEVESTLLEDEEDYENRYNLAMEFAQEYGISALEQGIAQLIKDQNDADYDFTEDETNMLHAFQEVLRNFQTQTEQSTEDAETVRASPPPKLTGANAKVTEEQVPPREIREEVPKSTKPQSREKKLSIAERYIAETTVEDRDGIAAKVVELRINATGSKPLAWREIREKLGLHNDQFHKVIRLSEGYRKAVIQRIKSLKAQEGGWEYNGKLEVLTGIELTEKELE